MPPDAARWRRFVETFESVVSLAGYACVVTPMFEDIGVFQRIGEATDVVSKEMYDFRDKGDRHVALRPEFTASVCRAFAQHRPTTPWKVWYAGPNFRYEKSQAGRFRQFDQVGVEVLGVDDPDVDVEVIALAWNFYSALGLRDVRLVLNSLGDSGDRSRFSEALRAHFEANLGNLSDESRGTLQRNPLRVLDSKREQDAPSIESAPSMADFLSAEAAEHFEIVQKGLRDLRIPFTVNDRLVRGLDYYRRTTFEFVGGALESAQNAVGGGGRYDGLVEALGGPSTPGIGFALGVDRTLLACDAEGVFAAVPHVVDVFVVDVVDGSHALSITAELRDAGVSCDRAFDGRSMKSQMKLSDRSGARFAVIVGPDEVSRGSCTVRNLANAEQYEVARDTLTSHLAGQLTDAPRRRTST